MIGLEILSNNGYLELDDLPHNCIFNKVRTGCGGTSVVLRNDENYIIAVPTTEVIVNKLYPRFDYDDNLISYDSGTIIESGISPICNLLGLYGDTDYRLKKKISQYLDQEGVKKIMCTYDKLPFLSKYECLKEYRLLVDEYHCLLKAYGYRDKAIDGVFDVFRDFKSFCFMSATPIHSDFKPNILHDVKEYIADWKDPQNISVILQKTNKPYNAMANIIKAYKLNKYLVVKDKDQNDRKSKEAFIFINSVQDIVAILNHEKLSNDECRIICADNESNRKKLGSYEISSSVDTPRMFNFITSKAFEGADFYSDTGICFVVSNNMNKNTLLDVSIDIPQIAGRIRNKNNPFRDYVVHIFNTALEKSDSSYQDVKNRTQKELEYAEERVKSYNNLSVGARNQEREELKKRINSTYIMYDKETDSFIVNDRLPKLELYNFMVKNTIYQSGNSLKEAYSQSGSITSNIEWVCIEDDSIRRASKKIQFKDVFERYRELQQSFSFGDSALKAIEQEYPFINEAYHKLGVKEVRALKYVQAKIKAKLINIDKEKKDDDKIFSLLKDRLPLGKWHPLHYYLDNIKEVYHELGYETQGLKGTLLKKWFIIDPKSCRYDGKTTYGYIINAYKTIYTDNTE